MNAASSTGAPAARAALAGIVALWALTVLTAIVAAGAGALSVAEAPSGLAVAEAGVSALARREIPALYLRLYMRAAARYGIDWAVLAAIGKLECDHGRDRDPSCTREGSVNGAGAGGPMQFIASTWVRYGVDADGDGRADRWDPVDAVFSAARYLGAAGVSGDQRRAIFSYNHAAWYVDAVLRWAAAYRAAGSESALPPPAGTDEGEGADSSLAAASQTPVSFIPGDRAVLARNDGHVSLIPTGVPATVQAMVVAGNELQALPYGPGGHPDPRGAPEEDCSSTVNYVLYRAGIRPIAEILVDNPLAQDYVRWGAPGPGRWVTIYATTQPTDHVFIVIAGLRLDTSRDGTDVGPNRYQDGPRWRLLDHIPTWARWSVRHPPGL